LGVAVVECHTLHAIDTNLVTLATSRRQQHVQLYRW
jgi:hypothetical protein